ncbi:MAG: hypothetical protein N3D11_10665, partial [Candidatus Sumerlaeia bacterium]|nr:hypothetical protein [Candidatus Sumerlaeia bacterium]
MTAANTEGHEQTGAKGTAVSLFLFLLCRYLLCSGDRYTDFPISDEWVMFSTTISLVEQGTLCPPLDERYRGQEAKYGLGLSLAAVPLYLLSRALMPLLPEGTPPTAIAFPLACATNAILCAAIGALFLATAIRLGYSNRTALAGALMVGTTTILAAYSKSFFSEPLAALCLLGAVHALCALHPVHAFSFLRPAAALRAGLWLALAVLARPDNVAVVPVFFAALWLGTGRVGSKSAPPAETNPQATSSKPQADRYLCGFRLTTFFFAPLLLMAAFIVWT